MTTGPQPSDRTTHAGPAHPAASQDQVRETIRRLREQGGTYRSIAGAVGLAPATVHDCCPPLAMSILRHRS
jgi:hypothetical protein